jgi:HEPN domain-containing protein
MSAPGGGLDQLRDELVEISLRHRRSLDAVSEATDFSDELFGFVVQQVIELRLKAVLAHYGTQPPRTHDIGALLDLLVNAGLDVPTSVHDAADLTKYAVAYRYAIVSEYAADRRELLALTDSVIDWSRAVIEEAP